MNEKHKGIQYGSIEPIAPKILRLWRSGNNAYYEQRKQY